MRSFPRWLVIASAVLLTAGRPIKSPASSQLNWGQLFSWKGTARPAPPPLARVLRIAGESLDIVVQPVAAFHLEGTLLKDPAHQETDRAKANFPIIFDLAVCARVAAEPLRTKCLTKASSALLEWAQVYKPTGNPIDEARFWPLFLATDLVVPRLDSGDRGALLAWIHSFATAGDEFYATKHPSPHDSSRANNWMAWRIFIRAATSTISQDHQIQQTCRPMLAEFVDRNFVSGPGGRKHGATYDFIQRDAFEYHIFDLQALVYTALFTPSLVDERTRRLVELGLNFIKPYYLGEQQHIEFLHTTNAMDLKRIQQDPDNTPFAIKPWNPNRAHELFRLARLVFPAVKTWTQDTVAADHYAPMIALLAAIHGEAAMAGR